MNTYQREWLLKKSIWVLGALFVVLLLVKFFWPLFHFGVPLGYDPGFYRYLFIRHADGFPPFVVAPMDEWAKGHPLGLFFFSTVLLKLGVPVSWLLGWVWNLFPVVLAIVFAWVIGKREGKWVGVLVLLTSLLSISYFDGFAAMYWKTYASLLWCVITYRLLEKKSWWAILTGVLCVSTHHQTGLLFGLTFGLWVLLRFIREARKDMQAAVRSTLPLIIAGLLVCVIGFITYLPILYNAVLSHIPELMAGDNSPGGSFPPALFYLRTEGILLALGVVGFGLSVKKERWTLCQLSALWSFVFVAGHLLFYRRFFLQLDFFLLPFAAIAIRAFWIRFSHPLHRIILICALLLQAWSMVNVAQTRGPIADPADFRAITEITAQLPQDVFVLGLDNQTSTLLRGWLPYAHVGGPGLFESTWSYDQWKTFILGTHAERTELLSSIHGTVYVFVSQYFLQYYGSYATDFLKDPCFKQTNYPQFYTVSCVP